MPKRIMIYISSPHTYREIKNMETLVMEPSAAFVSVMNNGKS